METWVALILKIFMYCTAIIYLIFWISRIFNQRLNNKIDLNSIDVVILFSELSFSVQANRNQTYPEKEGSGDRHSLLRFRTPPMQYGTVIFTSEGIKGILVLNNFLRHVYERVFNIFIHILEPTYTDLKPFNYIENRQSHSTLLYSAEESNIFTVNPDSETHLKSLYYQLKLTNIQQVLLNYCRLNAGFGKIIYQKLTLKGFQPDLVTRLRYIKGKTCLRISRAAYEEAVISLQGSSIRFLWKEIKAQFRGGYLRYPSKSSTLGKLNVGITSTER